MKREEKMNKPYVQSNYERIKDDNYQTIDPRCIKALVETLEFPEGTRIVDCCADKGSNIVYQLKEYGYDAFCVGDAFQKELGARFIVTNPPYDRKFVDRIMWMQIHRVNDGSALLFAALLRNNFDFAKSRYDMFSKNYYGQIHLMFRPWWSEERKAQPIHNYVWHIWKKTSTFPAVWYWREK